MLDRVEQGLREEARLSRLGDLAAHVDDVDEWHDSVLRRATREAGDGVLARLGVLPRFKGRRGRAEDDWTVFQMGAHYGDVARVVARRFVLLVARLVLLVDDDEPEVFDGREDS